MQLRFGDKRGVEGELVSALPVTEREGRQRRKIMTSQLPCFVGELSKKKQTNYSLLSLGYKLL